MSWVSYSRKIQWFNVFRGLWTQEPVGDVPFNSVLAGDLSESGLKNQKGSTYLAQANNVYAPGISGVVRKRPGFSKVRSTAINASGIFTGGVHLGELADEVVLAVSISGTSHNFYRDNANPPGAISGGTNPTIGQDNHVNFSIFHDGTNPGVVACTLQRDTPQFFTAGMTRSDFSITGTTLHQFT